MKVLFPVLVTLALAGCVVPSDPMPQPAPVPVSGSPAGTGRLTSDQAARNFVTAIKAVEPVAERICRERTRNVSCDFRIVVDDRPNQPANAFQTLEADGRPVLGFTLGLIADARNVHEIAFVIGHEAAHHILGHIPQVQRSASQGAMLAGILVAVGGGGQGAVQSAQQIGASLGARRYSKEFELQADALGVEITERAGFDALSGAEFFSRIPDPGDQFLGSHPPNAERMAVVRRSVAAMR
ncbi:M48 family metallopeptidase [Szabonella alba]|uniref:M48 family metallopeptidase n=1 Tax=Szabonella alba TaxID=2804194 RepID=A0A8K0V8I2_9RHOB|nr:M48 family metallopeptidase [Szabonella alba]MBL4915643.1 M48 family metallopeptidase [Szabonella alba]